MSHEHSNECKQLHEMLQSLVARLDVKPMNALDNGAVAAPPRDIFAPPASSSDGVSLELEIGSLRRALEVMDCDR